MTTPGYRHCYNPPAVAIDVFLCHVPSTAERIAMYHRVRAYWLQQSVRLVTLTPDKLGCSSKDFQRLRRIYADRRAKSSIYILTDDDCLPESPSTWRTGLAELARHREFGILSATPIGVKLNPWRPEGGHPYQTETVMEHHSVGGLRFCRPRLLSAWPPLTSSGYDSAHCAALRACIPPWRVGYALSARYNHLGEGKSTVWPKPPA